MKSNFIILLIFFSFVTPLKAQLPNGSIAPDFTVTDIKGNQHNLNTYMSQGKIVFLDFFNALCSGCWHYHYYESLNKIYAAYGPEGTNQLVVLYVDGVCYEGLPEINGFSENTYGDWVSHTNYPIVSTDYGCNLSSTYNIQAYPSLVTICPNGSGQGIITNATLSENPSNYLNYLNSCISVNSISNHVELFDSEVHLCANTTGKPSFKLRNLGENQINSATLKLYQNGVEIATQSYSGNLARWNDVMIEFASISLASTYNYTVKVISVNGVTPNNTTIAEAELDVFDVTLFASNELLVDVATTYNGSHAEWKIKNSSGSVIASDGPYLDYPFGSTPSVHNQPTVTVSLQQNQCYTFNMYAVNGFPYSGQFQIAIDDPSVRRYHLKNPDNSILYAAPKYPNFVDSQTVYFQTYGPASIDDLNSTFQLNVYPNPINDDLTLMIPFDGNYDINITDESGRIVFTKNFENLIRDEKISIDMKNSEAGNYFLSVTNEKVKFATQKIIKL